MDPSQPSNPGQAAQPESALNAGSGGRVSGSAGTLGPGSDIPANGVNAAASTGPQSANPMRYGPLVAVAVGVLLAVLVGGIGSAHAAWSQFAHFLTWHDGVEAKQPKLENSKDAQLDRLNSQRQAETLLEQAVANSDGAVDQISARVDRWQGKVQWDTQIATLTTAALNSNDMRVRESGVEVELAAYGLAKNSISLNYLLNRVDSPDHAQKIWALWALGLMGNRGVEPAQVVQVLTAHLKDTDEDSRRWAVEGLALVGRTETIEPLLQTMHDDPSASVRERAACSLAESGMFTHEQRLTAVPNLLAYSDDPALDAQTHAWAFQALKDITRQHLPNDSAAWRSWYSSSSGN